VALMRTQEEGALTSADIGFVVGIEQRCRNAAHGDLAHSLDCAACRSLYEALLAWFTAHAVGPDDIASLEVRS